MQRQLPAPGASGQPPSRGLPDSFPVHESTGSQRAVTRLDQPTKLSAGSVSQGLLWASSGPDGAALELVSRGRQAADCYTENGPVQGGEGLAGEPPAASGLASAQTDPVHCRAAPDPKCPVCSYINSPP